MKKFNGTLLGFPSRAAAMFPQERQSAVGNPLDSTTNTISTASTSSTEHPTSSPRMIVTNLPKQITTPRSESSDDSSEWSESHESSKTAFLDSSSSSSSVASPRCKKRKKKRRATIERKSKAKKVPVSPPRKLRRLTRRKDVLEKTNADDSEANSSGSSGVDVATSPTKNSCQKKAPAPKKTRRVKPAKKKAKKRKRKDSLESSTPNKTKARRYAALPESSAALSPTNKTIKTTLRETQRRCHICGDESYAWVACPLKDEHAFCSACVKDSLLQNYAALFPKGGRFWRIKGCPICSLTCPCSSCRTIAAPLSSFRTARFHTGKKRKESRRHRLLARGRGRRR
eukprot:TRINITY_DN19893_c0_g1_i1.p1 TRINITY_DN19893_c0_g1~~TRINITY_DN19893_c0_g1_i1.p1  ORF type:complete len:354 (+),score=66.50 TRINITY_DN19893_c0_g1_i1:39-1064(+)